MAQRTTVVIVPKKPVNWMKLIRDEETKHWHTFRVKIRIREWLLASKPASLDACRAIIADQARKMNETPTVEAIRVKEIGNAETEKESLIDDEGLCEFHRRPDRAGIWLPTANVKGMIKENWIACGFAKAKPGSRNRISELMYVWSVPAEKGEAVERDWVYLGEAPHPRVFTDVVAGPGPGCITRRYEYVVRSEIEFDIATADRAHKVLSPEILTKVLVNGAEHGLGALRSRGFGKFDILDLQEITEEKNRKVL